MRLLLLACLRAQTGNATTAERIQNHLHAAGHTCVLKDASMYESPTEIANLTSTGMFDAALAIHLYKGGRLLQGSRIPFGIIFGGTDINEDIKCEEKHHVMGAVLQEARFVVAFTMKMKELAAAEWMLGRKYMSKLKELRLCLVKRLTGTDFYKMQTTLAYIFISILEHLSNSGFLELNIKKQQVPYNANYNAMEASVLNVLGDQAIHCQVIL